MICDKPQSEDRDDCHTEKYDSAKGRKPTRIFRDDLLSRGRRGSRLCRWSRGWVPLPVSREPPVRVRRLLRLGGWVPFSVGREPPVSALWLITHSLTSPIAKPTEAVGTIGLFIRSSGSQLCSDYNKCSERAISELERTYQPGWPISEAPTGVLPRVRAGTEIEKLTIL